MADESGCDRPPFVVIEGLDGAGTTTQCRKLVDRLREEGVPSTLTREPSDGPVGSLIRNALSGRIVVPGRDEAPSPVRDDVLALLFAADRLDHVDAEIEPALERGEVVVSDRYYHSSFAYQGDSKEGGAFDTSWVRTINERARRPDLTVFLRAPAEVCLDRLQVRGRRDRYETADELEALEERYEQVFGAIDDGDEALVEIDATRTVDAIHESIYQAVGGFLDADATEVV